MVIKDVELYNFRIYRGNNKIDLSPDIRKNIIVVSGKNGYGKTTFLMSLAWCLYGKQMEKVDELYQKEIADKGGYTKYISNSLNRAAKAKGDTKLFVSITFKGVKIPEITCNEIKITRTYDVFNTTDNIEILIDGYPNELINELGTEKLRGEEIFIRDFILPLEIAKFFLFDAEKIVSLAEINSLEQRKQLSLAYSEVLGIKKYEELRENLERLQDEYRKQSANAKERELFIELESTIEKNLIAIEEKEQQIDTLREEKNAKKFESNQIQEKLIREGNKMTLEELIQFKNDETNLLSKLDEIQNDLKESFDLIPFALAGDKMLEISAQLEMENLFKNNKIQIENVDDKTHEIINDLEQEREKSKIPFDSRVHDFYSTQIKRLIKKYFYSEVQEIPSSFCHLHDFSGTETNEFNGLINNLKLSFKETFKRINSEYNRIKNELRSIQVRIREAEKNQENPFIAELRDKKDKLDKRILQIEGKIEDIKVESGKLETEIKTSEAKKTELSKKIEVSKKNKEKDEEAKKMIGYLKEFIVKFKEEKKKSLEKSIFEGLSTLMHKKNFISKVIVDISISGEDIDINLYKNLKGFEIKVDKETLSKGEQQLYATALLKALVEESEIEFPVFIDSPMQKFDDEHSQNIIKHFYPNISEQVVILPLINKELNEKEYNFIKSKISKAYIIHNIDPDRSEFMIIEPNNLIKKYNDLYNYAN